MRYPEIYERLIASARAKPFDGYTERHHIVPRCLGGSNDAANLVRLSARQHFVAHQLLAKIHGGKMLHAAFRMSNFRRYGNRRYAWLREANSVYMAAVSSGNTHAHANRGRPLTVEHRRRIGLNTTEKLRGRRLSAEKREAIRLGMQNPIVRAKISASRSGRLLSDAHKAAIGLSLLGRKRGPYKSREEVA